MTISVGSTITAASYNDIRDVMLKIYNATDTGYGPNIISSNSATTNAIASVESWSLLYDDVNKAIIHQTGANMAGVNLPATNLVITATFYNNLLTNANTAVANSSTVHPSQLKSYTSSTFYTTLPWNSQISAVNNLTWDSELQAHYFFNLGGYIKSSISYIGTPVGNTETAFVNFIAEVNTSTFYTQSYDRSKWRPFASTSSEFSYTTSEGVFTATVTYTKDINTVSVAVSILPPAGIDNIQLDVVNSTTVFVSTSTGLGGNLPSLFPIRKILTTTALSPFIFTAGSRSNPQTLKLQNIGSDTVTITSITPSSNGVYGVVVSTATNLTDENPEIVPITFPLSIVSNDEFDSVVYYLTDRPPTPGQVGTYYNSIKINSDAYINEFIVNTEQQVTPADFDFRIYLNDLANTYTYDDWKDEYGLSAGQKTLGINIADTYYLSSGTFGIINGKTRYGLYRKPDADSLVHWVNYTNTYAGGDYTSTTVTNAFFNSIDIATRDYSRSISGGKFFDNGFGNGDFYDKTLVDTTVNSLVTKNYQYYLEPLNGVFSGDINTPGFSTSLSNQRFNGQFSQEAQLAFSVNNLQGISESGFDQSVGPLVSFSPFYVSNTGTYSTDITITINGIDLYGNPATKTKTVDLTLEVPVITDVNYVKWQGPKGADSAVVGISYDRIQGTKYLTIGIGIGADNGLLLSQTNYNNSYLNLDYLGAAGDSLWKPNETGSLPVYKNPTVAQSWSLFLKSYGVWWSNQETVYNGTYIFPRGRKFFSNFYFTAPVSGTYTFEFSVATIGDVMLLKASDNSLVTNTTFLFDLNAWSTNNWTTSVTNTVQLEANTRYYLKVGAANTIANATVIQPAFGFTVKNPSNNIIYSSLNAVRAVAPYLYWQEVYRIPITVTGSLQSVGLSQHLVKRSFQIDSLDQESDPLKTYVGRFPGEGLIPRLTWDIDGNITIDPPSSSYTSATVWNVDSINRTLEQLRYWSTYYSYSINRKENLGLAGATTQRLIGFTTRGVRTTTVQTPFYGEPSGIIVATTPGVVAGGRGPAGSPGRLYDIWRRNFTFLSHGVVSRNYVAASQPQLDENGTLDAAGTYYNWSRPLFFASPETTFSDNDCWQIGLNGRADLLFGKDFRVKYLAATLDDLLYFYYGYVDRATKTFVLENTIHTLTAPGPGRLFDSINLDYYLPDPDINTLRFIAFADTSTWGAVGFHDATVHVEYTRITPSA